MNINYFDFGLHKGDEILMFLDSIKPLNANSVTVYGFEAHPDLYDTVSKRYSGYDNVHLFNFAISNDNAKVNLYIAESNKMEGNSIFKTKNNVNPENYIEVNGIKFSDWIKASVPNYSDFTNVIRFNIEGAELYLVDDLIDSGISENIALYLGASGGADILKCAEIAHLHDTYIDKLKSIAATVHQFCSVSTDNISSDKICNILRLGHG